MIDEKKIEAICKALEIDVEALPDHLTGTVLKAIAEALGADTFADRLYSTYLEAACEAAGIDIDNLALPDLHSSLVNAIYDEIVK